MLGAEQDASPGIAVEFASRALLATLARASGSDGGGGRLQTRVNWSFWTGGNEEGVGWCAAADHEPEVRKRGRLGWRYLGWLDTSFFFFLFSATQEERDRKPRLRALGKRRVKGSWLGKGAEGQGLREQPAHAVHSASHWLHTAILVN